MFSFIKCTFEDRHLTAKSIILFETKKIGTRYNSFLNECFLLENLHSDDLLKKWFFCFVDSCIIFDIEYLSNLSSDLLINFNSFKWSSFSSFCLKQNCFIFCKVLLIHAASSDSTSLLFFPWWQLKIANWLTLDSFSNYANIRISWTRLLHIEATAGSSTLHRMNRNLSVKIKI